MKKRILVLSLVLSSFSAPSLIAAPGVQLGGPDLTGVGAKRAGSADGLIPAYAEAPRIAPSCYSASEPTFYCDPWNDKALFTITNENKDKYAQRLTEGQKALFVRYPEFRMEVYPSRRTARFPEYVLENTRKNLDSCKTVDNGLGLEGCYGGIPFPVPKTGNEVMWNYQLQYHSFFSKASVRSVMVDANGRKILIGEQNIFENRAFFDPNNKGPRESNSVYFKVRFNLTGPARRTGEQTIALQDTSGQQRAWQYLPGQRRVKLAPDLSYDTPSPVAGGLTTMDQEQLFFGRQDRYDFKYLGVEEKFINYNNYAAGDYKKCPEDVFFTKGFPNPECIRWELHRVHVVEATLKSGSRHLLPKRRFYLDEDISGAGSSDSYDLAGKLIRVTNMIVAPDYVSGTGFFPDNTNTMDLERGAYIVPTFSGYKGGGFQAVDTLSPALWTSEDMARTGVR